MVLGCFSCPSFNKGEERKISSSDGRIRESYHLLKVSY